jgi:hypothetical protein
MQQPTTPIEDDPRTTNAWAVIGASLGGLK